MARFHHPRFLAHAGLFALMLTVLAPVQAQQRFDLEGDEWVAQPTVDPDSPEGILQEVRRLIAEGHGKTAENMVTEWIDSYPNHPLLVEAYLLQGDARVTRKHYYNALFPYEKVIRGYPASEQFFTALQREYDIAILFTRRPNRIWRLFLGMRIIPADSEGVEILIRLQERVPGTELGEQASLTLGDYYFGEGDMFLASESYDVFLLNYPNSRYREYAMLRLIESNLARFRGPEFDATGLIEAMERLHIYKREFPAGADQIDADSYLVRIDESLARKDFMQARWYERRGEYVSADFLYRRLVDEYPTTAAAYDAVKRIEQLEERSRTQLMTPELEAAMESGELQEDDREEDTAVTPGVEEEMLQEEGTLDPDFDGFEAEQQMREQDAQEQREEQGVGTAVQESLIQQEDLQDEEAPTGVDTELAPE